MHCVVFSSPSSTLNCIQQEERRNLVSYNQQFIRMQLLAALSEFIAVDSMYNLFVIAGDISSYLRTLGGSGGERRFVIRLVARAGARGSSK